jgi:hypothetical protein
VAAVQVAGRSRIRLLRTSTPLSHITFGDAEGLRRTRAVPPFGAGDGINCDQQTTTQIRLIWVIPVRVTFPLVQRSESRYTSGGDRVSVSMGEFVGSNSDCQQSLGKSAGASSSGPLHSKVRCERSRWEMPGGEGWMSLLGGNLIVAASKFGLVARGLSNAGHRRGDHERGTLVSTKS